MIVTHTLDVHGNCRIYLGGKGSLECWLEPVDGAPSWTFKFAEAVCGNRLEPSQQRAYAEHVLLKLADALNVHPMDLASVPFEAIAALHTTNPFDGRRVPLPKKRSLEHGFMSTAPHITRPAADFSAQDHPSQRRQR